VSRFSRRLHPAGVLKRIAALVVDRPKLSLAIAGVLLAISALGIPRIRMSASYFALLPEDAPVVREANRVRSRTGGSEQLVIALSGADRAAREEAARELAAFARRRADVRYADAELDTGFFEERALWMMDEDALAEVARGIADIAYGRGDPEAIAARLEAMLSGTTPDLSLESADGRYRFVIVVPRMRAMDVDETAPLLEALEQRAAALRDRHPGLSARFTGKLALVLEHQRLLERDFALTSLFSLALSMLILAVFSRSWRAPLIFGVATAVGTAWTLGIAGAAVGSLNVVSTMLFPVLAGLDIAFSIHISMRYEQRRRQGASPVVAMRSAVRETIVPSMTAGLTTAVAFLSLTFAELRGFVELGGLAAIGIVAALIATYLIVPPLLLLRDRGRAAPPASEVVEPASMSRRIALVIALACTAITAVALAGTSGLRFENDYRLLRPDSDSDAFFEYVDSQIGLRFDPSVLIVDGDPRAAREIIERRRGERGSRVETVIGLDDFLPRRSAQREQRIAEIRELLAVMGDHPRIVRAREIAAHEPWSAGELPSWVSDRFIARDGGAIVLVHGGEAIQSDRAALAWNAELDVLRARLDAAGVRYDLTTEALLPAWVYEMILGDGPRVLTIAALLVTLLVLIHFVWARGWMGIVHALFVIVPLAASLGWALALLSWGGVNLTMFNLVVFPCIIGIGVEDFVHVAHRHGEGESLSTIWRASGPALVLTSLTTAAGFGATMIARHPGLANVGPVALILIACTTSSALVFLPALLRIGKLPLPRAAEVRSA
jgi:predicted RND superfamily exporter protein